MVAMDEKRTKQGPKAVNEKPVDEKAVVFVSAENNDWHEHRRCALLDGRKFDSRARGLPDLRWRERALRAYLCFVLGQEVAREARLLRSQAREAHSRTRRMLGVRKGERGGAIGAASPSRRAAEVQSSRGPEQEGRANVRYPRGGIRGRASVQEVPADEQGDEKLSSMPSSAGDK